jgi:hypothetical protein
MEFALLSVPLRLFSKRIRSIFPRWWRAVARKELVGLPEGHTHFYPMMIGYPRFRYHRLPERKPPQISWK